LPRPANAGNSGSQDAPAGRIATNDRSAGRDTLSVTDNRTGRTYELPIENGTVPAAALRDIKTAPDDFGLMSYDPAFTTTAHCKSRITMIDGDKGILNYRGYPIEQLAEHSTYLEVAYLIVHGELPTRGQYEEWVFSITHHTFLHENMKRLIEAFRYDAHPMGILVSTVGALSTFYSEAKSIFDPEARRQQMVRLIAKMPTLAAFAYRASVGMPFVYPDNDLSYTGNFLNMLFRMAESKYRPNPVLERAALQDDYFVSRKLYPNVDFYSGLIYQSMKFPVETFPVLFAIPRTAGWLAQWEEMLLDPEQKIARPRQVYTGSPRRDYRSMDDRM